MRAFATIILGLCVVLAMEPAHAKRKRPAAVAPVVTTAEFSDRVQRTQEQCVGGVWLIVQVDNDNPDGCEYGCYTPDGSFLTMETLYPCP